MPKMTTYFGPAELKSLHITTSYRSIAYVLHCHSAGQTVALFRQLSKLQFTYTYSITALILITGTCTCDAFSAVQTTAYNTSTIAQIVLFLFKVSL